MRELIVTPGRICGEISAQGSKNSVLPLLSAALLTDETVVLQGCPQLADVECAISILTHLGRTVSRQGDTLTICGQVTASDIPECLMQQMRSSVTFLGALLARTGKATLTYPGGCELGPRPIDIHLDAFSRLGVQIQEDSKVLSCTTDGLVGTVLRLRFPSVGATENILMAAALAKGETVLKNAAKEPEIVDLARFLRSLGVNIQGEGSSVICIRGASQLYGCTYRVASDRIAAGTYLCAAAASGGKICISGVETSQLSTLCEILVQAGCEIDMEADRIRLEAPATRLKAVPRIVTEPYPGFPTDLQAPLMAALTCAEGETIFDELIFRNRFRHVPELVQMGADISVVGTRARVIGVPTLHGQSVCARELRGGAALVVAALAADSPSSITGLAYIERGYEDIVGVLHSLGISVSLRETPANDLNDSDSMIP